MIRSVFSSNKIRKIKSLFEYVFKTTENFWCKYFLKQSLVKMLVNPGKTLKVLPERSI